MVLTDICYHSDMLKKNSRRIIMANIKFDDYLNDELKNNEFKNGYLNEKAILESSLTVHTSIETINKLTLGKKLTIR